MKKNLLLVLMIFYFVIGRSVFGDWNPSSFKMPTEEEIRKKLTTEEYKITRKGGTEESFKNNYHDEKRAGIYVDVLSGEPLFSSRDKYDSGTGWPSFSRPLREDALVNKSDYSDSQKRVELKAKLTGNHLGHVFPDGPASTGLRYCMNSAALRFVPKEKMKEEGYGAYLKYLEDEPKTEKAVFAGGCFWCMESEFDSTKGVLSTEVGYTGGHKDNPTYKEVSGGGTGHKEAVQVTYDPSQVTYQKLLSVYWGNVDPFDNAGQFCDKGDQYQSAVFFSDRQKAEAEKSKMEIEKKFGRKVATQLLPAGKFYPAEADHQDFYKKNWLRYKYYRKNCGRDERLKQVWK